MQTHRVKWKVATSDGGVFYEGKGDFVEVSGQPSPWQRLDKYLSENKLEITSLSLYTDDGQTFNLPSLGKNPRFQPFREAEKPIDYNICRYIGKEVKVANLKAGEAQVSDWFTVAEAIYPSYKLQLWVDEKNIKNCWCLVVKTI
jgi:hypothetical protein